MIVGQTTQEALNAALKELEAWKAVALAAQAERDALVAQNKELLCYAADAERWFNKHDPNGYVSPKREKAQQHLAEIRAKDARAGFVAGYHKMHFDFVGTLAPSGSAEFAADQYANRIRQGGDV